MKDLNFRISRFSMQILHPSTCNNITFFKCNKHITFAVWGEEGKLLKYAGHYSYL